MNAIAPILRFGKTQPAAPALVMGGRAIGFGELAGWVQRAACYLRALGFQRGDRIGICLKDTPDHLVALLAVAHMGGVAVPLDWRARTNENARFISGLSLKCVLIEPDARREDDRPAVALDGEWQRGVAGAEAMSEPQADWLDPFVISATSGSTGAPRFTVMTHRQYRCAMTGMLELMDLSGSHRFLCTLPLYYSGGRNSSLAHLLRGDCVTLYPSLFGPDEYLHEVNRHGITVGALVPSAVRLLLSSAQGREPVLPGLHKLFCTGAPLHPEEKLEALRRLTPQFYERYGTAETLAISVLRPIDMAEKASSVGRPHSLAEIQIADESDRPVSTGSAGLLRIRSLGMGSPLRGETDEQRFRDGWFYPGETAHLDEAGFIFLHGRASDVILRSGAKVYPEEVERVLLEHAGVAESAVLGLAGVNNEESVIAFVVPNGNPALGELIAHCRARLTPHKVPQAIHFIAQLPRNTAGKVDKAALARHLGRAAS